MDLIQIISFIGTLGLDAVLVLGIIGMTTFLKTIIPEKNKKLTPLIPLVLGVIVGVLQIILAKTTPELWLRSVLGYPGISIAAYMLTKKYFIKNKYEKNN